MTLFFTKMHGLGNDFIVINAIEHEFSLSSEIIRRLSDRHFGVGFDQLLVVEPPQSENAEFRYRIFNADGNEVEQCGNGARCFARYVIEHNLTVNRSIKVETNTGLIVLHIKENGLVSVDMGTPEFKPENIPATFTSEADQYTLNIDGTDYTIGLVSMGNPHAVLLVDDIDTAPVTELGAKIENDAHFPNRINVGFMQVHSATEFSLRVFERGAGETLACGTGACAAMAVGRRLGKLEEHVQARLRGGTLELTWSETAGPVIMTGPAETVFEGSIEL